MQVCFDISETIDDAGVARYRAMLPVDFNTDGIPDPRAPGGWGDTVWEAIAALMAELDQAETEFMPYLFIRLADVASAEPT